MDNREKAIILAQQAGTKLDSPQLGYLYDLAGVAPDGISVECGTARGGSLLCWAAARHKRGPIIAVDLKVSERWYACRDSIRKWHPGIVFLAATSWDVGEMLRPQQEVAFCFIDACHGPEGIGRDVQVWSQTILPGGVIAWHDYGAPKCPAVKQCVDAWQVAAQWESLGAVGSTMAFRRPLT